MPTDQPKERNTKPSFEEFLAAPFSDYRTVGQMAQMKASAIFELPIFPDRRNVWCSGDTDRGGQDLLVRGLEVAELHIKRRNEQSWLIPAELKTWRVDAITPSLKPFEISTLAMEMDDTLAALASTFWLLFLPRFVKLELAFAHCSERGSLAGAALCLRPMLEEMKLLVGIVTLYRRLEREQSSNDEKLALSLVLYRLFSSSEREPIAKEQMRDLTAKLFEHAYVDQQARTSLENLEQHRRRMNEMVHPNALSHQVVLDPTDAQAARTVIDTLNAVYEAWESYGPPAYEAATLFYVPPIRQVRLPLRDLWEAFFASPRNEIVGATTPKNLATEFPQRFSYLNPGSQHHRFWKAIEGDSMENWDKSGSSCPAAAKIIQSARLSKLQVDSALQLKDPNNSDETKGDVALENALHRRSATRAAIGLYVDLFVVKVHQFSDLWLAMDASGNDVGAAVFARGALEAAGSLLVFRAALKEININLASADLSAEGEFRLAGKGTRAYQTQAEKLLKQLDAAVWTVLMSRSGATQTGDPGWLQTTGSNTAGMNQFVPDSLKLHHDVLSEISHGSYSRGWYESPALRKSTLTASAWAIYFADQTATEAYRGFVADRGLLEVLIGPGQPWNGVTTWRDLAQINGDEAVRSNGDWAPFQRAMTHFTNAVRSPSKGNYSQSIKAIEAGISILEQIDSKKDDPNRLYFLSVGYEMKGEVEDEFRNDLDAYLSFEKSLLLQEKVRERVSADSRDKLDWGVNSSLPITIQRLLNSIYNLGQAAADEGNAELTNERTSKFRDYALKYSHILPPEYLAQFGLSLE
jgi:hypothetical protein